MGNNSMIFKKPVKPGETYTFILNGVEYVATIERCAEMDNLCKGGFVSDWAQNDPAPGEFEVARQGDLRRYFDMDRAVREHGEASATAIFEGTRSWLAGDWEWVQMSVKSPASTRVLKDQFLESDNLKQLNDKAFFFASRIEFASKLERVK